MPRIAEARVIATCPGRNFVTLKIITEDGLHGLGDATLNGREMAVVSYLNDHVIPTLTGRDAARIEDTWQYLYRGAYWRRGPVTMTAVGAVDTALWDLKAKAAGMPLYQLLGGRSRDGVLCYGHANGEDVAATVEEVGRYLKLGYKAVRAQCGVPGLPSTYGVGKDKMFYEPAGAAVPEENVWSSEKYLNSVPELFSALRKEYGFTPHLLHDVHHRLTPIEAGRLGKALEPYALFWMEDPTPAENQESFRLIRSALAALYQVRTGCHGATDLSPVSMGAALHFNLSVPNFGIQEYMRHTPETDAVFPRAWRFDNGYLHPGETPGHGVDINEALAAKHPYRPASLPVNRLEDGTLWHW